MFLRNDYGIILHTAKNVIWLIICSLFYSNSIEFIPQLPYYIDGDVKLTQSTAILRHIGNKHNLCGTTEKEMDRINVVENQITDFKNGFVRLCYNPEFVS